MNRIELLPGPIDVAAALADVYADDAGGVCVFLGTTRAESRADPIPLAALLYEAFDALALKQLHQLVDQANQKWAIKQCVLLHRTGRVDVGQPSVLIAVATPHRADAFAACRWLIDSLKAVAAIWKKELWADGKITWVEGTPPVPSPGTPGEG